MCILGIVLVIEDKVMKNFYFFKDYILFGGERKKWVDEMYCMLEVKW